MDLENAAAGAEIAAVGGKKSIVETSVGAVAGMEKTSGVGENDLEQIIKGSIITKSLEHKIQQM